MGGFGREECGHGPFGHADWAKSVLWDELPEKDKEADLANGGWFYKFVTCLMPSFNQMMMAINRTYDAKISPRTVRPDLIQYLAQRFGIDTDLAEADVYQRMNIEIAARWRLIKGTKASYDILCQIHGFDVTVNEIWWNGTGFTVVGPTVTGEVTGTI